VLFHSSLLVRTDLVVAIGIKIVEKLRLIAIVLHRHDPWSVTNASIVIMELLKQLCREVARTIWQKDGSVAEVAIAIRILSALVGSWAASTAAAFSSL
jgi:hypothetical protein